MAENFGASFSIDVTNLKAGLAQANRLIRESESEFKAAAAGMDDWSKSQEGLEAKIKSLNNITEIQRKKVDALQQEYDNLIADGLDPTSKKATELRTKINNETAALNKNEAELKKQKKALEEMSSESNSAVTAADKLRKKVADQEKELSDLKEEYLNVTLEQGKYSKEAKALQSKISSLNSELGKSKSALGEVGEAAEKAGDGFTIGKGAIATFIGNGLTALVGACKNAVGALAGLPAATEEYREDMGKLATGFETSGFSAKTAKDIYSEFYSVLGESDRSVEAVNHLAQLTDNEKDLAKWSDIAAGVVGTFGDSLPIEGLTEAANETAKVGKVTGPLADALNWAGISEDEFNEKLAACNSEQERAQLITDTLNSTYEEAAKKYKEVNKSVIEARDAQQRFTDAQAELGEKIAPATTAVREGFAKILEKLVELTSSVDMEAFADKISGAFDSFINDVLPKIQSGLQWIIDNKDVLIAGIAGIGAAFLTMNVANMVMGVVNAFKAFKAAQEGATVAQWLLNVAMSANPIGIIVALIAGLVTAFVVLWNKCEGFRNFWIGLWDAIKSAAKAVVEWLGKAFSTAWDAVTGVWKKATSFFSGIWNGIKSVFGAVKSFFSNAFTDAWNGIKKAFSNVGSFFSGIWNTIKSTFTSIGTKVGDAIGGAFKSAINAVISTVEKSINFIPDNVNKMIGKINELPGVDIGRIPTVSLPRLAKGGIVREATSAIVGEDGAEAIIPLERNKEWIREVARELAANQKQGVIVNQTNNYSQTHSRYEIYKSKQQAAAAVKLAMMGAG
ncbi:MAG: hypothetical protein ACI4DY_11995 [Monoglobaceae bacterium]